jgi:hypothetical protein
MLEPILEKLLTIASGATPIGSAGRTPDEELIREERWRITSRRTMKNYFNKNDEELLREEWWRITSRRMMKNYFEKNDEELLREEWWRNYFEKSEEEKFESIIGVKHLKINSTFHSHRERFATSWNNNSKIFGIKTVKQGWTNEKLWFSSCVIATKLGCCDYNRSWR